MPVQAYNIFPITPNVNENFNLDKILIIIVYFQIIFL